MDWNLISNSGVAIGTLALAVFTWRSVSEGKKSIKAAEKSATATEESAKATHLAVEQGKDSIAAAQRSAEATELTVIQMKDSLMPYLDLDVRYTTAALNLHIRNAGPGLGIIRAVTVRKDVIYPSTTDALPYWAGRNAEQSAILSHAPVTDFVVGSGEEFTIQLRTDDQNFRPQDNEWISSLSLFYEDVYGRYYRTRLLYRWFNDGSADVVRTVGKEYFKLNNLPFDPASNPNIQRIRDIEGERPVMYLPTHRAFHRIEYVNRMIHTTVRGNEFTQQKEIELLGISPEWNGLPKYRVKIVGETIPFILTPIWDRTSQLSASISDVPGTIPSINPLPSGKRRYIEYGLDSQGDGENEVTRLYDTIERTLMSRLNN
jgi:hypothetical protein